MIGDIAVLNLQTVAALLMGYDCFVSDTLKNKANALTVMLEK